MATGTVKWYSTMTRATGSLRRKNGGKDLFVHHNGIAGRGLQESSRRREGRVRVE